MNWSRFVLLTLFTFSGLTANTQSGKFENSPPPPDSPSSDNQDNRAGQEAASDNNDQGRPGGGARNPVNGNGQIQIGGVPAALPVVNTPTCPFSESTESASALVNSTIGTLQGLIRQNENNANGVCSGSVQALQNAQRAFASLEQQTATGLQLANNGQLPCSNYDAILRARHTLAISLLNENNIDSNSTVTGNEYYDLCRASDQLNETCVTNRFNRELGENANRCENRTDNNVNNFNTDTRQNILNISAALNSLIANPSACGQQGEEAILQSTLQQATSVANFAVGGGLPGVGISLVGNLLSGVVNRIFNSNSPQRYLRILQNEQNRPGLQCLFYNLQNYVLECNQNNTPNTPRPQEVVTNQNVDLCVQGLNHLSELQNNVNSIQNFVNNAAFNSENANLDSVDAVFTNQINPVMIRALPELERAATTLQQSNSQHSNLGEKLAAINSEYRIVSGQPSNAQERQEIARFRNLSPGARQARTLELLRRMSGIGSNGLNLQIALDTYRNLRGTQDATFAQALQSIEASRLAQSATERALATVQEQDRLLNANSNGLGSVTTAMQAIIGTTQNRFAERVVQLRRDWDRSGANISSVNGKMARLNELFNLCMTTQGMSYFNRTEGNAITRAVADSRYANACSLFDCRDDNNQPTLFEPFNAQENRFGSGQVADRFANYQCELNRNLEQKRRTLRDNLRDFNGNICGPHRAVSGTR